MIQKDYKILARVIGRTAADLNPLSDAHEIGTTVLDMLIEYLLIELQHDNPKFSATKFMKAIEASRNEN